MITHDYTLTVIFPLRLASSLSARASKNTDPFKSFPALANTLIGTLSVMID